MDTYLYTFIHVFVGKFYNYIASIDLDHVKFIEEIGRGT